MGAQFPPLTVPALKAYARQPLRQVLVGNTEFPLPDNIADDTTNNSLNSRKLCYAPSGSPITDIVLAYPGFGLVPPETDFPVSYTVKASVEYPIGTIRQVFFAGATSATITPGRTLTRSDPLPIVIPAGAQFAVKTFATWTAGHFWLATDNASLLVGDWTTRGTGVADHTLDTTTLATTANFGGFAPLVYGTLQTPLSVVGLIGDSIGEDAGDWFEPATGHTSWGRGLRNAIPFVNLAKGGESWTNYDSRPEGRNLVLRDAITHLIWEMGGNDLFGGASSATLQSRLQSATAPFLARGIKCYAITLTPRSTSSDGWITAGNQAPTNAGVETVRKAYNTWLRTNWKAVGLSGFFDLAHACDPTDAGIWVSDPSATLIVPSRGLVTLAAGAIASVANANYNGNSSAGTCVAAAAAVPCVVYNYRNTPGSGGAINAVPDPTHPWFGSYTVVTPGAGYTYPPMVAPQGPFTPDGSHPNTRGWSEILSKCGTLGDFAIAPETFVL